MLKEVMEELEKLKDDKLKDFSSKLIPNSLPILGVKYPLLRKIAKNINQKDFRTFLNECDDSFLEIQLLEAYVIASAKMDLDERIAYLKKFVPKIRDWAVCDGLVSTLKCTKNYAKEFLEFLKGYQRSHEEFEVRFLAVMLMSYYLNDTYVEMAVSTIRQLDITKFYAKMGVAWFIATLMVEYKDYAYQLLKDLEDQRTLSMAIRKIRDSYRIPQEDKDKVLGFKK